MNKKKKVLFDWWLNSGGGIELNDFISSFRSANSDKTYIQRTASTYWRIWSPVDEEYAQYYDLRREISTADPYIGTTGNWGIQKYWEIKAPASTTGTFAAPTAANSNTSQVGATASVSFTGTGLKFASYSSNRGGIWQFNLNSGQQIVNVSVWRSTQAYIIQDVFTDLPLGTYSVVATFTGADPLNPPVGGGAIGWICRDTSTLPSAGNANSMYNRCFYVVGSPSPNCCSDQATIAHTPQTLQFPGHSEMSISIKGLGSSASENQAIPLHSAVQGTKAAIFADLATDQLITIDGAGNYITSMEADNYNYAVGGDVINLYQKYTGVNYLDDTYLLYDITSNYTFTKDGFYDDIDIVSIADQFNSTFYTQMVHIYPAFTDRLLLFGQEIDTTIDIGIGQAVKVTNAQIPSWNGVVVGCNKNGTDFHKSLALGFELIDKPTTMREDDLSLGQEVFWRAIGEITKLYPQIVGNKPGITVGDRFHHKAKYTLGLVPDAYNVLKSYAGL